MLKYDEPDLIYYKCDNNYANINLKYGIKYNMYEKSDNIYDDDNHA
jgi:hypothetical protein